jgi:cytochrome c-type biogenesis protein CcmE
MSRKVLLGTLLVNAAVLGLVFGTNVTRPIYSFGVADFLTRPRWDERVRVQGTLVHGTLCKVEEPCEYRFALSDRGQSLTVSYESCVVPDTFRDVPGLDLRVTVEGERCQGCHDFEAAVVMAQCPAKYQLNASAAPLPIPRCSRRKQPT